jgi:LysR family transcriptional regulator for bpeEF and oprC
VQNLEAFLGVRLLQRTTRQLSLTADGAAYYESCLKILGDLEEAEARFQDKSRQPKGRLRIDMPASVGHAIVLPRLSDFRERFPGIDLMIGFSDLPVDLVRDGVDCVLRTGEPKDSSLVARRLATLDWITCGAPEYFARHGEPVTLDDLHQHRAVNYFSESSGRVINWQLTIDGKVVNLPMRGPFAVNETGAYVACGLASFGMLQLASVIVSSHLQSGRLKEVLAHMRPPAVPISAIYPNSRHLSPAVRAFVDWAVEIFGELRAGG